MTDVRDAPVDDPDRDLLDMKDYARQLAALIGTEPPPFTVGIYGEWGTGKTSFVRLVRHFLPAAQVRFIEFSAWRHKTADELWRALIMEIARDLYDIPRSEPGDESSNGRERDATDNGWLTKIGNFMAGDAVVLRDSATPAPSRDYEQLVARLRPTLSGSINRTPHAPQLDLESLAAAVGRLSLSAVSTVSPVLAWLRTLLGLGDTSKPESLLRNGRDAIAARVESSEEFSHILRQLLTDRARGKRVCVFIDDLDRCMPDAALDLLEAIRLFFIDVPCIFIVAAGEQLIAQGLRLRYRAIGADGDPAADISADKGREYFEKIIQFGIRVPHRMEEQIHRLISAHYPEWSPATDIIYTAAGSNPRRVKQYCTWLGYKHAVASSLARESPYAGPLEPETPDARETRARCYELFKKMVELSTWHTRCAAALRLVTEDVANYRQHMTALESALDKWDPDKPDPSLSAALPEHVRKLYDIAVESAPLLVLFRDQTPPTLSRHAPEEVATLLALAAVRPDREQMLKVDDAAFSRIAHATALSGRLIDANLLVSGDLARWIELMQRSPMAVDNIALLADGASSDTWPRKMADLEARLLSRADDDDTMAAGARELLREASDEDRQLLLQEPRFSSMLREEIRVFSRLRDLPRPQNPIFAKINDPSATAEAAWHPSSDVVGLTGDPWTAPEGFREGMDDVARRMKLRADIAEQLLRLRTFAKLDALAHGWPELAQLLRVERTTLKKLHAYATKPHQLSSELMELWKRCKNKDQLLALLQMRPLFHAISEDDIARYFQVARALIQPGEIEAPSIGRPTVTELAYEDVLIRLNNEVGSRYELALTHGGETTAEVIELDVAHVHENASLLHKFSPTVVVSRDYAAAPSDLGSLLRKIGTETYLQLFPEATQKRLVALLNTKRNFRITWEQDPALAMLPWECLYVPPMGPFLGLSQRYSLIRHLAGSTKPQPQRFEPPLRMLAVMSCPPGTPQLDLAGEEAMLQETVGRDGRIQLEVLRGPDATLGRLQDRLRMFRPQLFHCVAHGIHADGNSQGGLMFSGRDGGGGDVVKSSQLAPILGNSPIQLAVLNSCDTGRSTFGDAVSGIAGAMIGSGIPAVIATTRKVLDREAVLFTREFYRALLDGYPLEASFVEARTALNSNGWDWAAYTLMVGTLDLEAFTLGPRGRQG